MKCWFTNIQKQLNIFKISLIFKKYTNFTDKYVSLNKYVFSNLRYFTFIIRVHINNDHKRMWKFIPASNETFSTFPALQVFALIKIVLKLDQYIVTSILTDQYTVYSHIDIVFCILFTTWFKLFALGWLTLTDIY